MVVDLFCAWDEKSKILDLFWTVIRKGFNLSRADGRCFNRKCRDSRYSRADLPQPSLAHSDYGPTRVQRPSSIVRHGA